jgi:hypothetical protein
MGPSRLGPRGVAQLRPGRAISTPIPPGQLRVIGDGRPLDGEIRQAMERFFGADFSGVRIHEGLTAQTMGALAFTLGDQLHFAPGLYDPSSREGLALLGHELAHVVQQRDGRVANPYGQGIAIVQDPELEAEADRMGQQIADALSSSSPRAVTASSKAILPKQRVIQRSFFSFFGSESKQEFKLVPKRLLDLDVRGEGLLHGTVNQTLAAQFVQLGHKKGTANAFYLPWKDGACTEGTVKLGTTVKYFFTASLSGCSIFCRYPDKKTIIIRHEARTDKVTHTEHEQAGFQLVFNSSQSTKWEFHAISLDIEETEGAVKKRATDFVVYAVIGEAETTFYVQERLTTSTLDLETADKTSSSTLVREMALTV